MAEGFAGAHERLAFEELGNAKKREGRMGGSHNGAAGLETGEECWLGPEINRN